MKPGAWAWTDAEVATLREYYAAEGRAVAERLPGRTVKAIEFKAFSLKLKSVKRPNAWTSEELAILREYYPVEGSKVAERLPNRSKSSIAIKAGELALRVNRTREPKISQRSEPPPKFADKYAMILKPAKPPTVAEQLTGLPWLVYPKTSTAALRIARICGEGLALGDRNGMPDEEKAFWSSIKVMMEALADRLKTLARVA